MSTPKQMEKIEQDRMTDLTESIKAVRRRGRNSRLETKLRKRLFVRILLGEPGLTREQVCKRVGIGKTTYSRWVKDESLLREIGQDSSVVTEQTRYFAYLHRGRALSALLDVIDTSGNDLARVRAAEMLLQIGDQAIADDKSEETDHGQDISAFLSLQGPTFIQIVDSEKFVKARTIEGQIVKPKSYEEISALGDEEQRGEF